MEARKKKRKNIFYVNGTDTFYTLNLLTPTSSDLPVYFTRRNQHRAQNGATKKPIFGAKGTEVWFGGTQDMGSKNVGLVWDSIETHTEFIRTADRYNKAPGSTSNVVLKVTDLGDFRADLLVEPEYDSDDDTIDRVILQKRKFNVDWADALSLSTAEADKVRDQKQERNLRTRATLSDVTIVDTKPTIRSR